MTFTMAVIDWGAIVNKVPEIALFLVFGFFVLELQKRFTAAQDKRDEMYEKRNNALVEAIQKVTTTIGNLADGTAKHHIEMTDAVAEMRRASDDLTEIVTAAAKANVKARSKSA